MRNNVKYTKSEIKHEILANYLASNEFSSMPLVTELSVYRAITEFDWWRASLSSNYIDNQTLDFLVDSVSVIELLLLEGIAVVVVST